MSGDEALNAGSLRPFLDDSTGTDDREAFQSDVSAAAYPAEQRSGSYFACLAALMNRFERGFADEKRFPLPFLVRLAQANVGIPKFLAQVVFLSVMLNGVGRSYSRALSKIFWD